MPGSDLKLILEDVADNLFNLDPYYQQGGDMVRLGGLDYAIDPLEKAGSRITAMQLDDGSPIEAGKNYKVAGWATVGSQSTGEPIWDVVAEYLRGSDVASIDKINTPKISNMSGNPGLA
jgi:sulfur-oxidizing protein SoxB